MPRLIALLFASSALLAVAHPAAAAEKAPFIKGVYAMEGNCEAWAASQMDDTSGTSGLAVEILTEDGFKTWESACTFLSITEKIKGHRWVAKMDCSEGVENGEETDIFDLDPKTGHITVTIDDNRSVFVRCDASKGN